MEGSDEAATVVVRSVPETVAITRLAYAGPAFDPRTRLVDNIPAGISPTDSFDARTRIVSYSPADITRIYRRSDHSHFATQVVNFRPAPAHKQAEPLDNGYIFKDRYEILKTIGRGGFSYVYLCQSLQDGSLHAIKEAFPYEGTRSIEGRVLGRQPYLQECRNAILREMIAISRANHPGIVRLNEAFEQNDTLCFSMQFVEGESLANLLRRRGALSYETIASMAASIVGAIEYLHSLDILHGDIKPGNVLLRPDKSTVLIDFGSTHRLSGISYGELTVSKGYSAPERYPVFSAPEEARQKIGTWSDIYGCAAVMAAMLTGREPPQPWEMPADRSAWLDASMPGKVRSTAEQKLRLGIAAGLAPNLDDRPRSAAEFLEVLGLGRPSAPSNQAQEPSGSVFVSYARKDASAVETVVRALQLRGVGVWIDRQDITPGEALSGEIARGLRAAKMIVFFSSTNSRASRTVREELSLARQWDKTIVTVRLDDVDFHDDVVLFLNPALNLRFEEHAPVELARFIADRLNQLAVPV